MAPSYSAMGTVGGFDFQPRTTSQAAVAAENQALASAKGRRIRCNRGGGSLATAECVAKFRAGQDDPSSQPNCSRDLGCSAGRMRAANFKEDDVTKSNYGKCILCGIKGNRDSAGRCYLAKCKAARKPAVDPLAMQESPILDDAEATALGEAMAGPGQERSPESIKSYMRELGEMLDTADDGVAASQDHIADTSKMVTPSAPSAPFVVDGVILSPFEPHRQPARDPIVTIRKTCLSFSTAAVAAFDLSRFKSVRLHFGPGLVGLDFSPEHVRGFLSVVESHQESITLVVNAQAFVRHYSLKGRSGVMSELEPGRFVVRLGAAQ